MIPAARRFLKIMQGNDGTVDDPAADEIAMEPAEHEDPYDPKLLQLRMRRKYQLGLIKKMLEDGGYSDLAKMTTVGRTSFDSEE